MTPEDIVAALESRGWKATVVSRGEVDDLVDIEQGGLMKCVDGRLSDHDATGVNRGDGLIS